MRTKVEDAALRTSSGEDRRRPQRAGIVRALLSALMLAGLLVAVSAGSASAETAPGPATVNATTLTRGSTVTVTAPGCVDPDAFRYLEARLVVGRGFNRRSAAIVSGVSQPSDTASIVVPTWAPSGRATIEVSCVEANFSGASDGVDIYVFDYQPVAVSVAAVPARSSSGRVRIRSVVDDGVLHVSGSGCFGTAAVSVARGFDLVGSGRRFHYEGRTVAASPDGRWALDLPLVYAVSFFRSPIAPGPMSAFASCDGVSYPPQRFVIGYRSPRPAVQTQYSGPSSVYLGQCSPGN